MRPLAGTVLEPMGDPVRGLGRQTWPAPTSLPERLGTTWGDNPVFEGLAAGRAPSESRARRDRSLRRHLSGAYHSFLTRRTSRSLAEANATRFTLGTIDGFRGVKTAKRGASAWLLPLFPPAGGHPRRSSARLCAGGQGISWPEGEASNGSSTGFLGRVATRMDFRQSAAR